MSFFLDLAPEYGGTRFGPFAQGATLGSDPARCHITLPAKLGIRPVHAWIVPSGSGLVLQVGEVGAVVVVLAAGRPVQVQGSTMIGPGDVMLLGGASGVKFTLQSAAQAPQPAARPQTGRRGPPTAGAMAAEARRQAGVAVMTTKGGAQAGNFLHRLQSGAFTNPRYVVGAIVAIGGVLFTGCSGLFALVMSQL
ncbi:MAG: hypothetical protein ACI8RZ_005161 [Myxococcota bacterium]|jgi:hypothetical protein